MRIALQRARDVNPSAVYCIIARRVKKDASVDEPTSTTTECVSPKAVVSVWA